MRVLYFGPARDCAGMESEEIAADGLTVNQLWNELIARHPALEPCRRISRVAIDMNYATEQQVINSTSEVAIIPPVAGG